MTLSIKGLLATNLMPAGAAALPAMANSASNQTTQFLEVENGRIAYDDTGGNGQLIIALPGMGDVRSQYRYLRPYLMQAGFRVVTMDIRGHGESTVHWEDYSAHAAGRDVLALIDKLGAHSAIVIGNSFAAGAAVWAAHDAPDKIRATVLIGPIVHDMPVSPITKALLKVGLMGSWRVWFWTTYWDSLFPAKKPADHEQYRALLSKNLGEPGRFDALKKMIDLSKADTEAIIGRNRHPSLIVMGTKDADFPDAAHEAQSLALRLGAEATLIEGAGHYPHAEMPEIAGPKIVRFLEKIK